MWQEIESDFPALYSLYIFPYILLYSLNGGASWLIVSSSTKLLYYITKCYLFKIAMLGKIGKLIGVKLMILCLDITGKKKTFSGRTVQYWQKSLPGQHPLYVYWVAWLFVCLSNDANRAPATLWCPCLPSNGTALPLNLFWQSAIQWT